MRIHIAETDPPLVPELRGWLAASLDALNTPAVEIWEARVTYRVQTHQPSQVQMQVECLLAGQTLCMVQTGATLPEAAQAVLHALVQQLRAIRPARLRKPNAPRRDTNQGTSRQDHSRT
jgi:hypothetical protein